MRDMTVCFLLRYAPGLEVLLGYKKRGFGVAKYAGIGGRVELGETIVAAACREVWEEIGVTITPHELMPMGTVTFYFPNKTAWNQCVHIFLVTQWVGEPGESDEMRPTWHRAATLPFEHMWDDSRYWLPAVIAGKPLQAYITYAEDNEIVQDAQFDQMEL